MLELSKKNTDPSEPAAVSHFCQELDHLKLKFRFPPLGKFCFESIFNLQWPSLLVWLKPGESVMADFSLCVVRLSICAGMLLPDVLEAASEWAPRRVCVCVCVRVRCWYLVNFFSTCLLKGRDSVGRWSCPCDRPLCVFTRGELPKAKHTHTHTHACMWGEVTLSLSQL